MSVTAIKNQLQPKSHNAVWKASGWQLTGSYLSRFSTVLSQGSILTSVTHLQSNRLNVWSSSQEAGVRGQTHPQRSELNDGVDPEQDALVTVHSQEHDSLLKVGVAGVSSQTGAPYAALAIRISGHSQEQVVGFN